jgi:hypothetical protein
MVLQKDVQNQKTGKPNNSKVVGSKETKELKHISPENHRPDARH